MIHSLASNIRRATECAQDGRYGKAVSALLALARVDNRGNTDGDESKASWSGVANDSIWSRSNCGAFRYRACAQEGQWLPHWIGRWCLRYTPSVPQGHFIMHQQGCGDAALTSLTNLTNHLIAGLAPSELSPADHLAAPPPPLQIMDPKNRCAG